MRRLSTPILITAAVLVGVSLLAPAAAAQDDDPTVDLVGLSLLAPAAAAQDDDPTVDLAPVTVAKVSGVLDPVLADFIEDSIVDAERNGDLALVFQLNSRDGVISDDRLNELAESITGSSVPVAVWVGPSGARALGPAAQLAGLVDRIGVAPGAEVGKTGTNRIDTERYGVPWGEHAPLLVDDTLDWREVIEVGVVPCPEIEVDELGRDVSEEERLVRCSAPLIGDFLVRRFDDLGFQTEQVPIEDEIRLRPITPTRFTDLSLLDQLLHTVASPPIAYLLFLIGLGLLVFELFTAGIGVAGVVGAISLILGSYGLAVLPTRWWAIALLVGAFLAYSVDIQTGVPRFWSIIGTVMMIVGTFALYTDGISLGWVPTIVGIGGTIIAMISGMPAMVRTRFSTPTIGRQWMIGEMGKAVADVDPDGTVRINDAVWRARTNRATPITKGDVVRVVAIDGLWLEVEPEEGGARDYRSRD